MAGSDSKERGINRKMPVVLNFFYMMAVSVFAVHSLELAIKWLLVQIQNT